MIKQLKQQIKDNARLIEFLQYRIDQAKAIEALAAQIAGQQNMSYDSNQIERLIARIKASSMVKHTHSHYPQNGYMQVVIIENGKLLLATVANANDKRRIHGSIRMITAQTARVITQQVTRNRRKLERKPPRR